MPERRQHWSNVYLNFKNFSYDVDFQFCLNRIYVNYAITQFLQSDTIVHRNGDILLPTVVSDKDVAQDLDSGSSVLTVVDLSSPKGLFFEEQATRQANHVGYKRKSSRAWPPSGG